MGTGGWTKLRTAAVPLGLAIALSVGQPGAAAAPPGATFRAETPGSPVASQMGHWVTTDGRAVLVFGGGHVLGDGTTFVARWTTPKLPGDVRWSGEGRFMSHQDGDAVVRLTRRFRYRTGSSKWSDWATVHLRLREELNVFEDYESMIWTGPNPARIQFQWELRGTIKGRTTLEGSYELAAD